MHFSLIPANDITVHGMQNMRIGVEIVVLKLFLIIKHAETLADRSLLYGILRQGYYKLFEVSRSLERIAFIYFHAPGLLVTEAA
jgi:hypothetical protein